ncbi:MAG: molecular chaperone DnaK, partial [Actinomycetes bacterium]
DNADKIPADAKANVDEPLAELKKALEGTDTEAIKSAVEKVATASQALGAAMYQSGDTPGATAASDDSSSDDDIVDAEVVDEGNDDAEGSRAS